MGNPTSPLDWMHRAPHASGMDRIEAYFAGFAFDLDDTDFADAIGELGNMVAGAAKKNLNCEASIGIPTVVIGANHRIARLTEVPCIVVPCNTDVGNFAVEISIRSTQVAKAAA